MTTPRDLYIEATRRGLRLEPAGDKLAVIPKGKCPPDFADVLRQYKPELLRWLSFAHCPGKLTVPPNNLPLNPIRPCPSQADARSIMHYIADQIEGTDSLCEWCLKRELTYWVSYQWPDQIRAYAAARDAACWQLKRTESEAWRFLVGFGSAEPTLINPTDSENPNP